VEILGLDHAALLVKDRERSRLFYQQILGMEEIDSGGNCWLRNVKAEIHLLETLEMKSAYHGGADTYSSKELALGHISHIALEVKDLRAALRHLQANHIAIACGPRPRGGGG
jgi:catechol 2,3-dioxygenase-like lactoylglutathione lyase family enzyme